MDILELDRNLRVLEHNGQCFNVEERLRLNMALQVLLNDSSDTDFEELMFWGRVTGLRGDYYIAVGVTYSKQYEFPTKTFYYTNSNDFKFQKFRDINAQHKDKYDTIVTPFTGESAHIYIKEENETDPNTAAQAEAEAAQEERDPLEDTPPEDPNKGVIYRSLIEEDRLLYTVMAIENDCQIIPQGAFRMTEAHEVERNVAFRGLAREQCFSLAAYSHFRNVQSDEKKELLLRDDAVFEHNFLDEVCHDLPKGMWSIQKDSCGQMAIIRNNVWSGYTAYHKACSCDFGGVYVGDGQKNMDLVFQL